MDYTLSNSYTTHAGTSQRMHEEAKAVPTAVSDRDMNSLIWSLMEVVKAGGMAGQQFDPGVPSTYQRVLQALPAAIASRPEMARSLFGTGYQKLPGGLLLQWGQMVGSTSVSIANVDVTFPITFPSACFQVFPVAGINNGNLDFVPDTESYRHNQTTVSFDIPTPTGFKCSMQYLNRTGDSRVLRYIAIGA